MLYFLFGQIIKQNRKEFEDDQEIQRRAVQSSYRSTQSRINYCSNCSTDWSWTNNDKSMAEDAVKVKGYKSRIQIADNPVTSVQQQKICFFSEFLKHTDHCIPIRIFKTASCLEIKKRNFSRTQRSCLKFRIYCKWSG